MVMKNTEIDSEEIKNCVEEIEVKEILMANKKDS